MHRNWLALFIFAFCFTSCGDRYIDRSAGPGPQGGPGYKPESPSDPPLYRPLTFVSIWPSDLSHHFEEWNFDVYVSGNSSAYHSFTADLTEKTLKLDTFKFGTVECLDNNSPCKKVHILLPYIWGDSPPLDKASIGFEAETRSGCELSGRFEWERSAAPWAKGKQVLISTDETPLRNFDFYTSRNVVELVTLASLIGDTARDQYVSFTFGFDTSRRIDLIMKFPTRAFDGTPVLFVDQQRPTPLNLLAGNHYSADLNFRKIESGDMSVAHIDITCGSPL